MEGGVGGDHRHQGDRRQVETLRGELGADQHIEAPGAEVVVDRLEPAPTIEHVGIQPADAQFAETRADLGLDTLGARPEVPDPGTAAHGAPGRHRRTTATVVAPQGIARSGGGRMAARSRGSGRLSRSRGTGRRWRRPGG